MEDGAQRQGFHSHHRRARQNGEGECEKHGETGSLSCGSCFHENNSGTTIFFPLRGWVAKRNGFS
jgi:hypothetical protein